MPRRPKVVNNNEQELIRDYKKFPLRPGEDLLITDLYLKGDITRRQCKEALWAADEEQARREYRRKNNDNWHRRRKPAQEEEEDDGDGDADGATEAS